MNKQRLEQLLKFHKEDPDDPFVIYAIATEYIAAEVHQKAKEYFEKLLNEHPDYLPAYYHAAHLYIELESYELAKSTFETGLELAKKSGDEHTLQELQNAYQNFLFEYE